MIQMNLLPDVKLEYIKAQQTRRLVVSVALIASAVSVGILVLILLGNGLQKKHLNDLSKDITRESSQLQQQKDIGKILTVQNQLQSLTALHAGKPAASRLTGYLNSLTPSQIAISSFTIDYTQNTAVITGTADALSSVNKYVDTLKYTTYTNQDNNDTKGTKAFSNVVLTSFGLASEAVNGGKASYSISLNYDKNIFDITQNIKLDIPNLTTTRASLDNPTDLFQNGPTTVKQGGQQ